MKIILDYQKIIISVISNPTRIQELSVLKYSTASIKHSALSDKRFMTTI